MTFAANLRAARQARGLSQEALAFAVGTTQMRISLWETGDRAPRLCFLVRLCAALKTTPNDLLGFSESPDK